MRFNALIKNILMNNFYSIFFIPTKSKLILQ